MGLHLENFTPKGATISSWHHNHNFKARRVCGLDVKGGRLKG